MPVHVVVLMNCVNIKIYIQSINFVVVWNDVKNVLEVIDILKIVTSICGPVMMIVCGVGGNNSQFHIRTHADTA